MSFLKSESLPVSVSSIQSYDAALCGDAFPHTHSSRVIFLPQACLFSAAHVAGAVLLGCFEVAYIAPAACYTASRSPS